MKIEADQKNPGFRVDRPTSVGSLSESFTKPTRVASGEFQSHQYESASWYESIILSSSSYFHHHHQHNQLFTPKVNKKSLVYIQPSPDYCTEVNNWHNEMRCWDKGHTSLAFIIVGFIYIASHELIKKEKVFWTEIEKFNYSEYFPI